MCLNTAWFDDAPHRARWRAAHGVTLAQAREALAKRSSTVYPIATEMGGWLYRHWTVNQLRQLRLDERDFLVNLAESDSWPGVREARRFRREAHRQHTRYISPLARSMVKSLVPKPPSKRRAPAEWLAAAEQRAQQRQADGVSLVDAIQELGTDAGYRAAEMALWLDRHWTLQQVLQLPVAARAVVLQTGAEK